MNRIAKALYRSLLDHIIGAANVPFEVEDYEVVPQITGDDLTPLVNGVSLKRTLHASGVNGEEVTISFIVCLTPWGSWDILQIEN